MEVNLFSSQRKKLSFELLLKSNVSSEHLFNTKVSNNVFLERLICVKLLFSPACKKLNFGFEEKSKDLNLFLIQNKYLKLTKPSIPFRSATSLLAKDKPVTSAVSGNCSKLSLFASISHSASKCHLKLESGICTV